MQEKIYFDIRPETLRKLAYGDNVYAWLLLHSHYTKGERHSYIYKNEFTFKQIAADICHHKDTVSKRFKKLVDEDIIREYEYNGKKAYKMPYFKDFETLDGPTTLALLTLPIKDQKEELIKTYAWLLRKKREAIKTSKVETNNVTQQFYCSANQILQDFGHSTGNAQGFERIRLIFTILQGAGIIEYDHIRVISKDEQGRIIPPRFLVKKVNVKAKDSWIGEEKVE